jgi:hypothetical protein
MSLTCSTQYSDDWSRKTYLLHSLLVALRLFCNLLQLLEMQMTVPSEGFSVCWSEDGLVGRMYNMWIFMTFWSHVTTQIRGALLFKAIQGFPPVFGSWVRGRDPRGWGGACLVEHGPCAYLLEKDVSHPGLNLQVLSILLRMCHVWWVHLCLPSSFIVMTVNAHCLLSASQGHDEVFPLLLEMWEKLRTQILYYGFSWILGRLLYVIHTHSWVLLKPVGSHDNTALLFVMKVTVWHFVSDFHKVMTACIVVLPSKCLLLRFFCTLIASTHPFSPCSLESD